MRKHPLPFHRRERLIDSVRSDPHKCLKTVFADLRLTDFKQELNTWYKMIATDPTETYKQASDRAQITKVYEKLDRLIEASFFLIKSTQTGYTQMGDLTRKELQIFLQENTPISLSQKERNEPRIILKEFASTFTLRYLKLEMWYWLHAITSHEGNVPLHSGRSNILPFYEKLICLIEISFILGKKMIDPFLYTPLRL